MERRKRWQFVLITVVILLTLYNILPTVLFYSKPLNHPIGEKRAESVAKAAVNRVNALEPQAVEWMKSYNKLLGLKASTLTLDQDNPQLMHIRYHDSKDAETLRKHLPRAGALIPFVPAQLSLLQESADHDPHTVTVQRNIPIHFDNKAIDSYFKFTSKREQDGSIAPLYKEVVDDRLLQVGLAVGGISENAQFLETVLHHEQNPRSEEFLQILSHNILTYAKIFGESSPIAKRYYATFTQGPMDNKRGAIDQLTRSFESYRDQLKLERIALQDAETKKRESGGFLDTHDQQKLDYLKSKEEKLTATLGILNRQRSAFSAGATPWNYAKLKQDIALADQGDQAIQTIAVGSLSPLVSAIHIDWNNDRIDLELHQDIEAYKKQIMATKSYLTEPLSQLIYNEIARISRETGETLTPHGNHFAIQLSNLTNSQSLLVMNLGSIAEKQAEQLLHLLKAQWNPSHPDLKRSAFPIYDYKTFQTLPAVEKKIGLVVYAPAQFETEPPSGFRTNSVYVIAKGTQEILSKLR